MMTHNSSTAMLESLLAEGSARKGFVGVVPRYNRKAARMLLGLHAALLIEFAVQLHILYLDAHGEGLTPLEQDSLQLATHLLREDGFLPTAPPDDIVSVSPDDAAMRAAEKEAKRTLPEFLNVLKEHAPPSRRLSVKVRFKEGKLSEYMWVTDLAIDGGKIRGAVANFPQRIKRPRFQQQVAIGIDQIADWIVEEEGQVRGGFTTRVLQAGRDNPARATPTAGQKRKGSQKRNKDARRNCHPC